MLNTVFSSIGLVGLVVLVGLVLWLVSGLAECLTWYKNLGPPFIGLPNQYTDCYSVFFLGCNNFHVTLFLSLNMSRYVVVCCYFHCG